MAVSESSPQQSLLPFRLLLVIKNHSMEVVDLAKTAPQLYSMGACGTAPVDGEVGVATCEAYKREEPARWDGFWMEMGIYRGVRKQRQCFAYYVDFHRCTELMGQDYKPCNSSKTYTKMRISNVHKVSSFEK
ncbi:hypothetical protein OSTOST_09131 [Ostertagia ostertagi]